jgi:hypothetical protein
LDASEQALALRKLQLENNRPLFSEALPRGAYHTPKMRWRRVSATRRAQRRTQIRLYIIRFSIIKPVNRVEISYFGNFRLVRFEDLRLI